MAQGTKLQRPNVISAEAAAKTPGLALRTFQLNDVMREAREMIARARETLDDARREAELILVQSRAQAQAESIAVRESAFDAAQEAGTRMGHEEGYRQGLEQGRAEALDAATREFAERQAQLVSAFREIMDAVNGDRADWAAAARQDLIELAMAIARRVVRHVGEREREVVLANLEEAVRLTGARSEVTILVHPADAETARMFAQSLLDLKEHWEHIQVVEEPEVSAGGCRIQWGSGSVDASLETQLERIEAELRGESA